MAGTAFPGRDSDCLVGKKEAIQSFLVYIGSLTLRQLFEKYVVQDGILVSLQLSRRIQTRKIDGYTCFLC